MDQLVQDVDAINIHQKLQFVAISILFYDWFITFGAEVDHIWHKPKSASAFLFLFNRYHALVGNLVVVIMTFITMSGASCKEFEMFRQILILITQLSVCNLLTLRTWALYERSRRVLAGMVSVGGVLLLLSVWAITRQRTDVASDVSGCHIGVLDGSGNGARQAVPWEALFVYGIMIISLTVFKTWQARGRYGFSPDYITLFGLILRDGVMYFTVMALGGLANVLTFYYSRPLLKGVLSTFSSCMSVTLASRLLLNLHTTTTAGLFTSPNGSSELLTTVEFNVVRQEESIRGGSEDTYCDTDSPSHVDQPLGPVCDGDEAV